MQPKYDPKEVEPRIRKFWEDTNIFKFDINSKKKIFSIDTPPPTVSGALHIGHVMHYSQFEFVARYKRMRGFNLFFPIGFDNNGLATEILTEKKRKIRAEDIGREKFRKLVMEVSEETIKEYADIWKTVGISCDWSLLYRTIDDRIRKISQFSFLDLFKMNRVYRAKSPIMWCTKCKTALAQVELEDKYFESNLNYIEFDTDVGEKITIATTRPELMPACVGVSVHPDDERYKKLLGKNAVLPIFGRKVPILPDSETKMEYGTGAVYYCTYGGTECVEWMKRHKEIKPRPVLNDNGTFNEDAGILKGLKVLDARKKILEELDRLGVLKKQEKINHTVNVHERCGTPIEFLLRKQWFIKYLDLKENYLKASSSLNWYPSFMKIRLDNWIDGLKWDWCISRQRFHGVPFPLWYCKKCGEIVLADEKDLPIDPIYDKPKKKCKCGSDDLEPERDIFDTWATSSLTPFINAYWGEENNLMEKIFPMDLRPQGHDIITFWLFNTIVKSLFHTGKVPFNDIMISGHGLDSKGKKMSKSKGNVVDPLKVIEKYSTDALRFWAASAKLGDDLSYKEKDVATGQKILTKLWNASRFVSIHMKKTERPKLRVVDEWILTRLMKLVKECTENFDKYEYSHAKQKTEIFFWHDFCDNYLEMVKHRLYSGEDDAAKYTLYKVLLTTLKLFTPFIPYITEEIYQDLFKEHEKDISISVSSWPEIDEEFIEESERSGDLLVDIISRIRQWKHDNKLALNVALREVVVKCDEDVMTLVERVLDDLKGTMKIKDVKFERSEELEIVINK